MMVHTSCQDLWLVEISGLWALRVMSQQKHESTEHRIDKLLRTPRFKDIHKLEPHFLLECRNDELMN
jgi:hypothetical protein